jgi:acyl-CoA synthetase (AMP-forming)/AMP-acid ligase II
MLAIDRDTTIGEAFAAAAERYAERPFLAAPANPGRDYHPDGVEISYAAAAGEVRALAERYREAGVGVGTRVALLLDSRPEHLLHKLALNAIGACCVPVNPEYRPAEIAYLVDHSKADLAVVLSRRADQFAAGLTEAAHRPPLALAEELDSGLPSVRPAPGGTVDAGLPASILYTSGTTGRPKGCLLSHRYELASGAFYATRGALAALTDGDDRVYNPLPLYHVNASIVSFYGVLLTGNCQVQTDRFSPQRWWEEVVQSRATVVHYLGVIVPLLLARPVTELERRHQVRFGLGAGVEPQLHAVFEERFGFPLLEVWGMTEMVRILIDNAPPRRVGTRCFGKAVPGIEVRVVDDADADVPVDVPGEMVIRHSAETPREGFFSGYLDDEAATAAAWRNGWFHTGDIVSRDADGYLHFVDRKKNIIRRSGENIAAAEIEALLLTHPQIRQAAVLAVPDEVREEEVYAAIVLREEVAPDLATARSIFDFCFERLAYFKAPGFVHFANDLPTTGTQKIQKHQIFKAGADPRSAPGTYDLRALKRRDERRA